MCHIMYKASYKTQKEKVMDYVPEDLIIVTCNNGHEHQMHLDAVPSETVCPFCGGKLEAKDD